MCGLGSLQPCPTLCDPIDCSLASSCVHRTLQVRTLDWVAIPSPRGSSLPRDQTRVTGMDGCLLYPALDVGSLPLVPPGKSFDLGLGL